MDDMFWWDTHKDNGCVNAILKFSVEVRRWYLVTDVKVRLKRFFLHHAGFEEYIQLWKRLQIVKKDFGEEKGRMIIQEAVQEIQNEFNDPEWTGAILEKIAKMRETLNDDFIKML